MCSYKKGNWDLFLNFNFEVPQTDEVFLFLHKEHIISYTILKHIFIGKS